MNDKALTNPQELLKQQLAALDKGLQPSGGIRIKVGPAGISTPDGKEGKSINVVIVSYEIVHSYYGKPYNPNEITPPDCFAHGQEFETMAPIDEAPDPQASACSICPQNEFGSAPNGKGKACRNSRLIAVLPAASELIGDHPMWTLSVPPTSIRGFEDYLRELRDEHGLSSMFVATTITQDKKSDYAAPRFKMDKILGDDALNAVAGRLPEARKLLEREPNYERDD